MGSWDVRDHCIVVSCPGDGYLIPYHNDELVTSNVFHQYPHAYRWTVSISGDLAGFDQVGQWFRRSQALCRF